MERGYKVFNPDWTCSLSGNTKQYTCPGKFKEDVTPTRCGKGMHFCRKAADCFNYYSFNPDNKVAEVIAYGDIAEEGDKCCTNKLEVVREIPWQELLEIVNIGDGNTGNRNAGNRNAGDGNTGNVNTGDRNTGSGNTGDWNAGDGNTGNGNTGSGNTGNWNAGDWNAASFSAGCFNTAGQAIFLFDRRSDWTYLDWLRSDACRLLNGMEKYPVKWIGESGMTEEEKAANPTYITTGGYLRVLDKPDCAQAWWDGLSDEDRNIVRAIPNFDAEIFRQCTGIKTTA